MIPKIVSQVWIGEKPSEFISACMAQTQKVLKDWKYNLISDEILYHENLRGIHTELINFYKYVQEKGRRPLPYGADVLKLATLYAIGGVVIDADEWIIRDFSNLLDRKYLFNAINGPKTPMMVGEHVMGAEPKDEFILYILKWFIKQRIDTQGNLTPHLGLHVRQKGIPFLSRSYFCPHARNESDTDDVNYRADDNTYGIHCYSSHHYDVEKLKSLSWNWN